ncbi:hypothetical protein WICPIJ_004441 [Wickerhamomyces pijperi]|uniref:Amidase domain-containing protein n=1 Tax=Wickerhamomyces pijperi TaxID=599730 RepID=A0A9P8Q5T0_WICPI|nr:hypothetical protein WICPIJ_004441 [Wickerhamomyces pijperi]
MYVQGRIINDYTTQQVSKISKDYDLQLDQDLSVSTTLINKQEPIKSIFPLTQKERTLINLPLTSLISELSNGHVTAVEVTKAYVKSASYAHQLTNCLTEILFQEAVDRAHELDLQFQTNGGNTIGPLHGVPISVKDEFDIKSVRTTLGLVSRADDDVISVNSPNVEILINAGAIIIAKTAVPIGAFNRKTFNNLFGVTCSSFGADLNPGGSTGGEASLVSMKGSALGIGSDLGGSIRQPCAFSGLFGLRPTSLRVPHLNQHSVVPGLESLRGVNGPIGRDIDTLRLYMRTILSSEPWRLNPHVVPLPWNEDAAAAAAAADFDLNEGVTIAVLRSDHLVVPTPPIQRAIEEVVSTFLSKKVQIIEVPEDIVLILQNLSVLAGQFMGSSGCGTLISEIEKSGEDVPYLSSLKSSKDLKTSELWGKHIERDANVSKFLHWWDQNNITAMLAPVTAQAYLFQKSDLVDHTYGPFVNVLDFPSVTFPVTKIKSVDYEYIAPEDQQLTKDSEFVLNEFLQTSGADKARFINNIPVNLQLLGFKFQEERLLKMADTLLKSLNS